MKKVIVVLVSLLSCFPSLSQRNIGRALDMENEEVAFVNRLSKLIPTTERYQYSEFQDGRVFYTTHKESNLTKLNYDRYFSHASMINEKGDTLFVANFAIVKYVLIDRALFYYDNHKGYFEILSNPDDFVRLVVQRQLNIVKREVLKDYEKPQTTSTKKLFSAIYVPVNPVLSREKVTLSKDDIFYLMNKKDETILTSKAAFLKSFPKRKQEIENHLQQMTRQRSRVKFDQEEDLKKLLQFCLKP